jgi:hypothetical protein
MKKIYMIVADVDLFDDTRGELERIEGENFDLPENTQFMSGKIHRHLCEMWDIDDEGKFDMLRVYPIEDFTSEVNDDNEIFTDSFISYVTI